MTEHLDYLRRIASSLRAYQRALQDVGKIDSLAATLDSYAQHIDLAVSELRQPPIEAATVIAEIKSGVHLSFDDVDRIVGHLNSIETGGDFAAVSKIRTLLGRAGWAAEDEPSVRILRSTLDALHVRIDQLATYAADAATRQSLNHVASQMRSLLPPRS